MNIPRLLNRDSIKLIAMITMLLNHIGHIFLTPGTLLYEFMVDIGYFTAITMCYFLVEGYSYTRSRKKYLQRLLLFAVISQPPFLLALKDTGLIDIYSSPSGSFHIYCFNMMFTLVLCFLVLMILDSAMPETRKNFFLFCCFMLSILCDWAVFAPVFTYLFRRKSPRIYLLSALCVGVSEFVAYLESFSFGMSLAHALGAAGGILLSGICILYFYNGKQAHRGRKLYQWFFYLFYPAHLLVLYVIKI